MDFFRGWGAEGYATSSLDLPLGGLVSSLEYPVNLENSAKILEHVRFPLQNNYTIDNSILILTLHNMYKVCILQLKRTLSTWTYRYKL
jgi:hypothetical protein